MHIGIDKYTQALILQSTIYRHRATEKVDMRVDQYQSLKSSLGLDSISDETMRIVLSDNLVAITDLGKSIIEEDLPQLMGHINKELEKGSSLTKAVLALLTNAFEHFHRPVMPKQGEFVNIGMQLNNLILVNHISFDRTGFSPVKDSKYGLFLEQVVQRRIEHDRKLFDDLKGMRFD